MSRCSGCCDCLLGRQDEVGDNYRVIFLVNSDSGGRKGETVLQLVRDWGYLAYDLSEFSKNEHLYYQLRCHMLDSESESAVVVCFAGGDGTGSWAFKTMDRALLSTQYSREPELGPAGNISQPTVPITRREDSESKIANPPLPIVTTPRGRWAAEDSSEYVHSSYLKVLEEHDRICREYYASGRIKFCSIPLGTGNDLSRCLGWNSVYCGNRKLRSRIQLMTLKNRDLTWLDRWRAIFQTEDGEIKEWRSNFMLNYLSVGYTADVAYQFDRARDENPQLYKCVFMNKLKYVQLGVEKVVFNNPNIKPHVELFVDGKMVELRDIRTLVFHNIRSMSDGVDFWRSSRGRNGEWKEGQMGDGIMEVTSSNHVTSFVKARYRLTGYTKVAQGSEICLVLKRPMAIQLDGESWIEEPGTISLTRTAHIQVPVGPKNPRGLSLIPKE